MHTILATLKFAAMLVLAAVAFYGLYRFAKSRMGASTPDVPGTKGGSSTGGAPKAPK